MPFTLLISIELRPRPSGLSARCTYAARNSARARATCERAGSSSGSRTWMFGLPRRRYAVSAPSTSTTRAPTVRVSIEPSSGAAGHRSSAPYGFAGSVAASITTSCFSCTGARRERSRSTAGRKRKLRRTEVRGEVSAANAPALFKRLQHVVDRAKPAGKILSVRGLAKDDAITREQLLRDRVTPDGLLCRRRAGLCKCGCVQAPSTLRRRRRRSAAAESLLIVNASVSALCFVMTSTAYRSTREGHSPHRSSPGRATPATTAHRSSRPDIRRQCRRAAAERTKLRCDVR